MRCLTLLLKGGAEIEAADADGITALIYAASHGKLAAVQFLHDHGAMLVPSHGFAVTNFESS
jgi:ankyrin repeat protein